ncbi:MAG TPA: dethiobiotin synthase, partial [Candidatus Acidoferrum sp.]|nr:dethiobiotin synthase [Candidatus Acidoferrum sp.]
MTARFYVTGTDTDVGKSLVTAAVAGVLRERHGAATVVKIAQTGLDAAEPGDAQQAAELAGCAWRELARFPQPADPWTAALAVGAEPLRAGDAADAIGAISGPLVAEGSGGAAVPLNEDEAISDVAVRCGLRAVLVVGLRLGCLNHATLTLEYLTRRGVPVDAIVLCERWGSDAAYLRDVRRVLERTGIVLATVPFAPQPEAR